MGKCIFVLPDQHYTIADSKEGGVDRRAESCAHQALEIVKPDVFVNIGDCGEWASVSPWQYKKKKRPPLKYTLDELKAEAKAVNAHLDMWDTAIAIAGCKEKHFIEGNHEVWIDNLVEENEHLEKDWAPQNLLRLKKRGYRYHPYGKYVKFGKLNLYHGGHYWGMYHTRLHALNLSANVMYGHTHDMQSFKIPTLGGHHGAWSIGCICDMDKAFLKGRPTNWSHGFAVVHVEKNGLFHVETTEIQDGMCYVWGRRVKG